MSRERTERAHLTIAPPSKKGNNHNKRFKIQRRNDQGNSDNPSRSYNGPKKGIKK